MRFRFLQKKDFILLKTVFLSAFLLLLPEHVII